MYIALRLTTASLLRLFKSNKFFPLTSLSTLHHNIHFIYILLAFFYTLNDDTKFRILLVPFFYFAVLDLETHHDQSHRGEREGKDEFFLQFFAAVALLLAATKERMKESQNFFFSAFAVCLLPLLCSFGQQSVFCSMICARGGWRNSKRACMRIDEEYEIH